MKKYMLVAAVMTLSVSLGMPQMAAAAGTGEEIEEPVKLPGIGEVENLKDTAVLPGVGIKKEEEEVFDEDKETLPGDIQNESGDSMKGESADNEEPKSENLQIPQKMAVVIDPWEMDGQGQIYSEQYVVRNAGETAGILTMTGSVCESQEQNDVIVRTDKEGLHDDEAKSIYMEMEFGSGEKIVLSRESSEYQAELQPGEELLICFTGEVNEYASDEWKDGDVTVGVVYSWKMEEPSGETEDASGKDGKATKKEEQVAQEIEEDVTGKEEKSVEAADERITNEGEEKPDESSDEGMTDEGEKEPDEETIGGDEIKTMDLQIPQTLDIAAASWKIDEEGRMISEQYIIRNAGELPGTLVLSELICRLGEQSEAVIQTEKEKLHDDGNKAVYMEMMSGKDETVILNQKGKEETRYEAKLDPGEEISIRFVGELNGIDPEDLEKEEITVTAVCSWYMEAGLDYFSR